MERKTEPEKKFDNSKNIAHLSQIWFLDKLHSINTKKLSIDFLVKIWGIESLRILIKFLNCKDPKIHQWPKKKERENLMKKQLQFRSKNLKDLKNRNNSGLLL